MDLDELVFHPWSVQGPRNVPTFVGGSGSHVIDTDGRRYLDFSSQLVFTNLGHQHPRIVAAVKEQADRLCTLAPGHGSDVRGEAARVIVEVAPDGLGHVLFTTGGTEAIEHAVTLDVLVQAIERAKSARPQAVTEALHGARFEGGWTKAMPGGSVQFDRAGLNTLSTPIMVQWRSKELVTVWPKDVAQASSVWHA